jgi:hypothetical protein
MGHWEGGTGGDFDVLLPEIGKVEIKYLGPFAKSTNVPFGSGYDRRIADTDFEKLITSLYNIARTDPNIIRQLLTEAEASYFFGKTFGQLYEDNNNLTTKSLRLIGRLLRNSDSKGGKLKENGLTFERMKLSMEKCLKDAIGEAQYILFLGERTDPNSEGVILKGQYYLMPREKVKYWMFYRIYKNDRIKIAPFSTEKDFIEKTVKEKKMEEAPLIRSYRGEHDGILGSDVDNYDPSLVIPKYEIPTMEDEYTKGDISIKSINDGDEIRYGLFVKQNLASVIDLISFELDGVDPKKFRPYQVVNVITKKEFRRKGYAKQLYSFVLNNHKVIVSDSIVYKNSQEIWDSFISTIAERFNYDKEANKFSEYNPINDENIVYVAFSKTKYPIEELPNK